MPAPIFPMVNIEKWKSPDNCGCVKVHDYQFMCLMNPFTDFTPLTKRRIRCEHCGATERLISGECAYCRQY